MGSLLKGNVKNFKNTNVSSQNENLIKEDYIIRSGLVEAIDDDFSTGRIKVRVREIDGGPTTTPTFCNKVNNKGTNTKKLQKVVNGANIVSTLSFNSQLGSIVNQQTDKTINSLSNSGGECNQLPWAIPLIPLNIQTKPKVNEMVLVIFFDRKNPFNGPRAYIGPLMSYTDKINFSNEKISKSTIEGSPEIRPRKPNLTPKIGDFTGSFPEPYDISLMSRNNADIVLPSLSSKKDNITKGGEILLRAGKFITSKSGGDLLLNDENMAYFRLKQLKKGTKNRQPDTHAMLFADYISIVSHVNGEEGTAPNVRKINPVNSVSTDNDIKTVHNNLSPLIRGDQLILFLELLRDYVQNHNHPYPKHPATNTNSKPDIEKFDLNRLLSTNIRIN
jgi:hypothetical protein